MCLVECVSRRCLDNLHEGSVFFTHASMPQLPPWKECVHTVCASRRSLNEVVAAVGFD